MRAKREYMNMPVEVNQTVSNVHLEVNRFHDFTRYRILQTILAEKKTQIRWFFFLHYWCTENTWVSLNVVTWQGVLLIVIAGPWTHSYLYLMDKEFGIGLLRDGLNSPQGSLPCLIFTMKIKGNKRYISYQHHNIRIDKITPTPDTNYKP